MSDKRRGTAAVGWVNVKYCRADPLSRSQKSLSDLANGRSVTNILQSTNNEQRVLGGDVVMVHGKQGRGSPKSGEGHFDGRDLLVGRPERA